MRQQENEAFRRDLEEAAASKVELGEQLSDARAEASSWQHQLVGAKEGQDALKERLRQERTLKQSLEQQLEVRLMTTTIATTAATTTTTATTSTTTTVVA